MQLSFDKGYFVLYLSGFTRPVRLEYWEKIDDRTFRTTSIKAAKRFRDKSDDKAEKIFRRVFVKFYPEPNVSRLTFLDPHQVEGVKWILTRSRSYLAHAPGAGKTAQAITAAVLSGTNRGDAAQSLFIAPPSLLANWEREIDTFAPKAALRAFRRSTIGASKDEAKVDWSARFILCPDSMLAKPWVLTQLLKRKWDVLAVDEASRFKEHTSQRAAALFGGKAGEVKSSGLIYRAKHTVLMDGSPMPNRPMELWGPTFAMAPEIIDFMSQHDFGLRYCGATVNDWGAFEFKYSSNEDELREKLQKSFMHVVPESALTHPERRRKILFMNEDVRTAEHKSWDARHLSGIDVGALDDDVKDEELSRWRRELGIRKVPFAVNYIKERVKLKNESLLVFAWHREVCEELFHQLKEFSPGLVMGGTHAETRELYFREFQESRTKIIIGNILAMGRGHNLQNADRIVFVESSWSNETNVQAEKRASRRGSVKEFVLCDYICAPQSLDEAVLQSVFRKDKTVKKVIGG